MYDIETKRPLLIVLTPVLNEAWIMPAFLKATSLWADYIIIADQMSTDGTREIVRDFVQTDDRCIEDRSTHHCEVRMIDNPRQKMHMAATRRLLFEEAKKIEGDKILFALDADEFLSGNFPETEGWKKIIQSEPGDVFCFRWQVLSPDGSQYSVFPTQPLYWAVHMDEDLLEGEYPDDFIHEWRLPWPKRFHQEYTIEDIYFLHFRNVNYKREHNKQRFYQIQHYSHPSNTRGGVSFHRQYESRDEGKLVKTESNTYDYYLSYGVDIWKELNLKDEGEHYSQVASRLIKEIGASKLRKLDIWDKDFLEKYNIEDPRRPIDKLMHWYLRKTHRLYKSFIVHSVDYIIKRLY